MLIARAYLFEITGFIWRESWLNAKWANVQLSQFARATTDSNDTCWALPLRPNYEEGTPSSPWNALCVLSVSPPRAFDGLTCTS